jgi:hypothetical protein
LQVNVCLEKSHIDNLAHIRATAVRDDFVPSGGMLYIAKEPLEDVTALKVATPEGICRRSTVMPDTIEPSALRTVPPR